MVSVAAHRASWRYLRRALHWAPTAWWALQGGGARHIHQASTSSFDYYYEIGADSLGQVSNRQGVNSAQAALEGGIPSSIIEFQIGIDEAIRRFNSYQSETCKGMHAHNLLSRKPPTTVHTAYFPSWCFTCNITAEFKGVLGFKDAKTQELVWKDQEDWVTLSHKQDLSYTDRQYLQVYASYNFERHLGQAALLPSASCLSAARPLAPAEAAALSAPAAAAAPLSLLLRREQQGPATVQVPLSTVSSHGVSSLQTTTPTASTTSTTTETASSSSSSDTSPSTSKQAPSNQGSGAATAAPNQPQPPETAQETSGQEPRAQSASSRSVWDHHQAVVHPPDMHRGIAWQLAYRGLLRDLTEQARQKLIQDTGASDARDIHVVIEVHQLSASLLYQPVYIAHYQHGQRHKQGTSTVLTPQMFYAAISGLEKGGVVAYQHVSPEKAQAATATLVGGFGLAAGSGPTWLGLEPLWSFGAVESLTLAAIATAFASIWARGLPQVARNNITLEQVKAEREFYRQYDARETKTAAALAASMAAAEETGQPPKPLETGEQSDEYMQWLWMDHDWRRWEMDEPWNWDAVKRRQAAERIAAKVVARRKERQQFLERLLEERRKREYELEQEQLRAARGGRAAGSRRRLASGDYSHGGVSAGEEVVRRRRDFLGYYKLLGLSDAGDITTEVIKAAFKSLAMQHHPDKVMAAGGGTESQQEAHVRFQRLQMAYDVLRDPEKRRAYDRGQLAH